MIGLHGMDRDSFIASRPDSTVDAEGDTNLSYTELGVYTGAWGPASATGLNSDERRQQQITAVISTYTFTNARPGDRLTQLKGGSWDVIAVEPVSGMDHFRLMLKQVA